jgi:hypothetical protein
VTFGKVEPEYAPMEPAIAVAASLSPKLEGTTFHAEGNGNGYSPPLTEEGLNGNVTAGLAEAAVAQAADVIAPGAAAPVQGGPPSGAVGFPGASKSGRQRPRGHWFVAIRGGSSPDTQWPMTVAKLGSGRKDPAALAQLQEMNPHLWTTPSSGVIAEFRPGDEVNVPGAWSDNLIKRGFKLKKD